GTPGVGKTVLAKSLSRRAGFNMVGLGKLVRRKRTYKHVDRARKTYVVDEGQLRRRLAALSRSPESIVLSTHLIGRFLPKASVKMALVLRLDLVVLYWRVRTRGWTKRKAWENTEAEILDVCLQESRLLLGPRKVYEIDTTRKSASAAFRLALQALSGDRTSRPALVNWLV